MYKKISTLCLIVAFGFSLNGCSSMSAQARRERAYRHYVQKKIKERNRAIAKAQKAANRQAKRQLKEKMKLVEPSEPRVTTGIEDFPSVSAPVTAPEPAPSFKEPMVNPITVSASSPDESIDPSQP